MREAFKKYWNKSLEELYLVYVNYEVKKVSKLIKKNWNYKADFFFIQIGANDGKSSDLIYDLVIKYKWKGILIEPIKYFFTKLKENYKEENHKLKFENVAISNKKEVREMYYMVNTSKKYPYWVNGLGSFSTKNIEKHKNLLFDFDKSEIKKEKVKCISLKELLKKHKIKNIDLICMDVEGFEYEIFKQIDFKNIKPRMILFEHKHLEKKELNKIKKMLIKNNYKTNKTFCNTLAISN